MQRTERMGRRAIEDEILEETKMLFMNKYEGVGHGWHKRARLVVSLGACCASVACSQGPDAEATGTVRLALDAGSFALINELKVNPPSGDQPWEYIELIGPPGMPLTDVYFAAFDGDGNNAGTADFVVDLGMACGGPCSFGENGLLLIKSPTGGHVPIEPQTVVVTDSDLETGGLENGTNSFVLIQSATALIETNDYDTDNDGTLEVPAGAEVLDSIAWTDGDSGDFMYGGVACDNGATPDAATRFPGNTATVTTAWYCGDLDGTTGAESTLYDGSTSSANLPAGAALTPGGVNDPQTVDAGVDAAPDGTEDATEDVASDSPPDAEEDAPIEAEADASLPVALVNELKVNPPGTDDGWEFVELRGSPGASLAGLYFLTVEGDPGTGGTDTGVVDFVVDLGTACSGACSFGPNGLLYIKATSGHPSQDADTNVLELPDLDTGSLENGTTSYILLSSPVDFAGGSDLDANDDGTLELPVGASILDSIAWTDGDAGDLLYGGVVCTPASGTPDAATRLPSDTSTSADAWYCGDLDGADPDVAGYDEATGSEWMPSGAVLTPGAENYGGSTSDAGAAGMGGSAGGGGTAGSDGGTAGSGGAAGVGGAGAAGGSSAAGGTGAASGSGGSTSGTGGSSVAPAEEDNSGCSCRTSRRSRYGAGWLGLLMLWGLLLRRSGKRGH